jgi:hypothetical protein
METQTLAPETIVLPFYETLPQDAKLAGLLVQDEFVYGFANTGQLDAFLLNNPNFEECVSKQRNGYGMYCTSDTRSGSHGLDIGYAWYEHTPNMIWDSLTQVTDFLAQTDVQDYSRSDKDLLKVAQTCDFDKNVIVTSDAGYFEEYPIASMTRSYDVHTYILGARWTGSLSEGDDDEEITRLSSKEEVHAYLSDREEGDYCDADHRLVEAANTTDFTRNNIIVGWAGHLEIVPA